MGAIELNATIGFSKQQYMGEQEIIFEFTFDSPTIYNAGTQTNPSFHIELQDLPNSNRYNKPRLPIKSLRILLPQGNMVEKIEVTTSDKFSLGKGFNIELGGAVIPLKEENPIYLNYGPNLIKSIINRKTANLLQTNSLQESIYTLIGVHNYRGYSILHVNIHPVQYMWETGEITYHKNIKLTVKTVKATTNGGFRDLQRDQELIREIVDNPAYVHTYSRDAMQKQGLTESYKYIIITNEELKNANGEYTFQDLVDYKYSKGINSKIVTVEEIESNPDFSVNGIWGDNNPDNPFYESEITGNIDLFDDIQAKIRNFIRYAYMTWETDYVLLAGDADTNNDNDNIIPLRGLFADEQGLPLNGNLDYETDDLPSDVYYACLDGNFNYDSDHHFGDAAKFNVKDDTIDEADLYSEVWVGRACVDSEEEVSNFVKKTLSYDQTFYDSYFSKILFLGETLGHQFFSNWGGDYKDVIEPLIPAQYNLIKLYDRDEPGHYWDMEYYAYLLNDDPPLIINHDGHGSPTHAMRVSCDYIEDLTNEKYYFIYSHTCLAGSFDNCWPPNYYDTDCVAEYFTVETPHGAFAAIMNSRYGLGSEDSINSPSGAYDESFFEALFTENIKEIGRASHYSKEDNIWRIDENGMRWTYYETNLFGDPEVSIKDPTPQIDVSVNITRPVLDGCLYFNDGEPVSFSFLKRPVIIGGLTINVDTQSVPSDMIEYVEFYIDNSSKYFDEEAPYEWLWDSQDFGVHELKVVAHAQYSFNASDKKEVFRLF